MSGTEEPKPVCVSARAALEGAAVDNVPMKKGSFEHMRDCASCLHYVAQITRTARFMAVLSEFDRRQESKFLRLSFLGPVHEIVCLAENAVLSEKQRDALIRLSEKQKNLSKKGGRGFAPKVP